MSIKLDTGRIVTVELPRVADFVGRVLDLESWLPLGLDDSNSFTRVLSNLLRE